MEKSNLDSQKKEEFQLEMQEERKRERKKKSASKPVFKAYNQSQITFLPMNLEEMIPEKHLVRVVNSTIEKMNIEPLVATYVGGGSSAFHPLMMMKVILYSYSIKVYSSRRIEKELRENVNFMWLSGNNRPDHSTINSFRSGRLKDVIEKLFVEMLILLVDGKYVDLSKYFVDGTKLRADASRASYVWKKNTLRYKEGLIKKVKELFQQIDEINKTENAEYGNKNLEEMGEESQITSERLEHTVEKLNKLLEEKKDKEQKKKDEDKENNEGNNSGNSTDNENEKIKRLGKAVKQLGKAVPKLNIYEQQEKILGQRNSYSKTDPDATFLMMKNDEVLPAYNVIIGTQNQYIINYTIHQKASESDQFISHMRKFNAYHNRYPDLAVGDATFGNEENYKFLEENGIRNYLKYNTFHYESKRKYREDKFQRDNFKYDEQSDVYLCPNGRELKYKQESIKHTGTGFEQSVRIYQSESCKDCQLRKQCKKGKSKKEINVNRNNERLRKQARENLTTEIGYELREKRNIEPESCFGDLKHNQGYRRFRLRGQPKVNIEFGLLSISHNIRKIALTKG